MKKGLEEQLLGYYESFDLKQLGFTEDCFGYYPPTPLSDEKEYDLQIQQTSTLTNPFKLSIVKAPTWEQAFGFFREKYQLKHRIEDVKNATKYTVSIKSFGLKFDNHDDIFSPSWSKEGKVQPLYDSYEEARYACLDALIQLVKNS